jgi:hypothetical protein
MLFGYSDGYYVEKGLGRVAYGLNSIADSLESLAASLLCVAFAIAAIPVLVKILPLLPPLASRLRKYVAKIDWVAKVPGPSSSLPPEKGR